MAIWQVEQGTAHGRGFAGADANGLLAKFYTWVTKSGVGGGPAWYIHDDQSAAVSNQYIVVCDVAVPAVNDVATGPGGLPPKFIKIGKTDALAGYINVQYYLWWDNSTQVGRGLYAGYLVATYDDADFEYRFRGGEIGIVIHTRLASTWYLSGILEWEGDSNLVEGTDKYGVLDGAITAGSSKVVQLHAGQAANFTLNKYYYIYDFVAHSWVDYCKCTNVDLVNDRITISVATYAYPDHSVIASYAHRFHAFGTTNYDTDHFCGQPTEVSKIPYCSSVVVDYAFHNQTGRIYGGVKCDYLNTAVSAMVPDDYSNRAVMRPIIVEDRKENYYPYSGGCETGMNRAYGQTKHMYVAAPNARVAGSDGLVIGGKNYLKFHYIGAIFYNAGNTNDVLFLDTVSTS